jgi:hypothetical protein
LTFGAEFKATHIAIDLIITLHYKLRMFGVPIEEATNLFVDNQSVVLNAATPTSVLKKKHNAIVYHKVRESVAANIVQIAKVAGCKNLADLFTKPPAKGPFLTLVCNILYLPNAYDVDSMD